MSKVAHRRRFRPRFRLRTLLVAMTLLAVFFGRQANWMRHRRQFAEEQKLLQGALETDGYWVIKWICELPQDEPRLARLTRKVFREEESPDPLQVILVEGEDSAANLAAFHRVEIERAKSLYPEAGRLTVEFAYPKNGRVGSLPGRRTPSR